MSFYTVFEISNNHLVTWNHLTHTKGSTFVDADLVEWSTVEPFSEVETLHQKSRNFTFIMRNGVLLQHSYFINEK